MDFVVGSSYMVFISWGLFGTVSDTSYIQTQGDIDDNNLANG